MSDFPQLSKDDLEKAAANFFGGDLKLLSVDELRNLMTISQFCTDLALNEIEDRGELTFHGDSPIVPYQSDHAVETILTR